VNAAQLALLAVIAAAAVGFLSYWALTAPRHPARRAPTAEEIAVGAVSNFFDALGIGSFATSTSYFRLRRMVPDVEIPGTLNIGHAPAAIAEALIYITIVSVDPWLLAAMTAAMVLGSWIGAGVVVRIPKPLLLAVLGSGTLIAGVLFVAVNLDWLPGGGQAFALSGWRFWFAVVANFLLGSTMAAGIGMFGPCMIMLSLLGMHPRAAFPIMMSGGALQQMVSGTRYLKRGRYSFGTAVGLGLGGVFGVCLAAFVVRSLPVVALRWLVAVVALYVAADFLKSALMGRHTKAQSD